MRRLRTTRVILLVGATLFYREVVHADAIARDEARITIPDASLAQAAATLSLADAQHAAITNNWDLLAAKSDVDAAVAQKIVARQFPNPTFSWSTTKINIDGLPSGTPAGNDLGHRNYDTVVAINELFEIGGKRASRKASANAGLEGAEARFMDAKRLLDLAVAKAYITTLQAEENVRVLTQSAQSLRKEAQIAVIRLKAGDISISDKDQIEIAADRFELDAKTAEITAASSRIALEVLLGVPQPRGDVVLSDKLETLSTVPVESNPAPDLARADIVAAEAALRKAEAELRLQKAQRIPDPTPLLQYEHQPPDQPTTIGLGVSLPLPIVNRNTGAIYLAQAARDQAKVAVEKVEAQVVADITTARLAYDAAVARWRTYREVISPKSDKVRKTVAYAYEKGGASLLDLLLAERNDNDVRLAATQAASDTAVAAATLKAALNVMERSK